MQNIMKNILLLTALSLSVWAACSADLDMGGNKITNVATPTSSSDAVTKGYVDDAVANPPVTAPEGYGIIYAGGHYWLDRNLGATKVCDSVDSDPDCWGDLYQWGRPADGHEKRDSATVTGPTSDIQPGHGNLILVDESLNNWLDTNVIYLWSTPGSTNNGVCPEGWSVPTVQDFADLALIDSNDAFTKLKLSESGARLYTDGRLINLGTNGYYWTTTVQGEQSYYLVINLGGADFNTGRRDSVSSIRCVKH